MTAGGKAPVLADTLRILLPGAEQTLVLQVCLCERTRAAASWNAWRAVRPDVKAALDENLPGLKRLLPLLHASLVEKAIAVDPQTMAVLRAAAIWEERRAARVHDILGDVLGALETARVSPLLWKGVAFAETAYPRPELRHCHDIDLLVSPSDVARAEAALGPCGFAAAPAKIARQSHRAVVHADGLPVSFHVDLPGAARFAVPRAEMVARAEDVVVSGRQAKVLRPADALLCLCAHVVAGSVHDPAGWVADATFLLRAGLEDEEWRRLAETAAASGLALPLHVMLSYLHDAIGAAIPEGAVAQMAKRATSSERSERDTLLLAARRGRRLGELVRLSGWRSRAEIVRWLVAPSPAHFKSWCAEHGYRWTPLWYVARPMRRLLKRTGAASGMRSASGGPRVG